MLYSIKIIDCNNDNDIIRVVYTHNFDNAIRYYQKFISCSYPEIVIVKMTVDDILVVKKFIAK